jgi:hypothetical protein
VRFGKEISMNSVVALNSQTAAIDFTALVKGQVVTQVEIESAYGIPYATQPEKYHLRQMSLAQEIMRRRSDLYTRCSGQTVVIMIDSEADAYRWNEARRTVRKQGQLALNSARIDTSGFSEEQRKISESRDRYMQRVAFSSAKELSSEMRLQRLLKG